jgi:hypothetical protein
MSEVSTLKLPLPRVMTEGGGTIVRVRVVVEENA